MARNSEMREDGDAETVRLRKANKKLRQELREARELSAKQVRMGYANGYNDAKRVMTNELRGLLGLDSL